MKCWTIYSPRKRPRPVWTDFADIVTGDEDDPCLEPALLMKRSMPNSGLVVLPRAGHTINIEEPEAFNRALFEFFTLVDEGRAAPRDPRSLASGILGYKK